MLTWDERLLAVQEVVRNAKEICQNTAIVHARNLWSFFCTHGCHAEPVVSKPGELMLDGRGWIVPGRQTGNRKPHLRLIALSQQDHGCFGEVWDGLCSVQNAFAYYFRTAHLILLRHELAETPFVSGTYFLHEIGHAERAVREGTAYVPHESALSDALLVEERDIHRFMFDLWEEHGGSSYRQALADGVSWVTEELRRQQRNVGEALIGLPSYPMLLETALGPAPRPQARNGRKLLFDLHVNMEVVRRSGTPHPRAVEVGLMRAFYEVTGFTGRFS